MPGVTFLDGVAIQRARYECSNRTGFTLLLMWDSVRATPSYMCVCLLDSMYVWHLGFAT
jgi:hypothetical protein